MRPIRKAASKAALAIKTEANDSLQDNSDPAINRGDKDDDAFAALMANRSRPTPGKRTALKPSEQTPKSRTLGTNDSIHVSFGALPDLEDLISDASQTRRSGSHPQSYHHFTSLLERQRVQDALVAWYDIHHRKLPWRVDYFKEFAQTSEEKGKEENPSRQQRDGQRAYEVWVSEIMCQQTQIATVIPYYNTWMEKWPTLADLAAADLEDVNKVWTGLGYYSRAMRLHQGAQKVLKEFNGILPSDPVILEKQVPGVGRYTAGAIVSHAYNVPAELVDGNVIRVLSRLRAIGGDVKSPKVVDLHWQIAKELVHQERPGCFNQALMEIGATICTPQNPKCGDCPVQTSCRAFAEVVDLKRSREETLGVSKKRSSGDSINDDGEDDTCLLCVPDMDIDTKDIGQVTQYPRKAIKKAPREEECAVCILERIVKDTESGKEKSLFLLVKRPEKGLLAGMWEFPTVEQDQLHGSAKSNTKASSAKQGSQPATTAPLSTYKQRSAASQNYLESTLGFDHLLRRCTKSTQRRDLGQAQHLFSHIRKTYHTEWVVIDDTKSEGSSDEKPKGTKAPEMQWLTVEELEKAAIPTGINKTYQLMQKFKAGQLVGNRGRKRKGGDLLNSQEQDPAEKVSSRTKRVKAECGLASISKFFSPATSSSER
ncbi:hypothetical protein BGW38_001066 [Lunasporangiospora selenospora]|uniref:Adenine DNA glycosylase n=1 Tax=Lunasporangiospora selenospora TaxID=979761 RepID=A0A9P6KED9_9FUNG|nr:hypothetical protein BGW38_001066 [Lunasporangiospora selenospora]